MEHHRCLHQMEMQNAAQQERARAEQQQRIHDLDLEKRLKFIDSLLQDKDKWVKQCERLTQDLKVRPRKRRRSISCRVHRTHRVLTRHSSMPLKNASPKRSENRKANGHSKRAPRERSGCRNSAKRSSRPLRKLGDDASRYRTGVLFQALEPKFVEMSENHKNDVRRLRDKIAAQEKLLAENEHHTMHQRQRLVQVLPYRASLDDCLYGEDRNAKTVWKRSD